ncbi:MAG: hypothetical protein H6Q68_2559 [Firmicutes bacterium]|nr:hypothetical protein [Bacillota bacterium]
MRSDKIYLVRHGEIATGGHKRYIGQIDLPLDETGRRQAAALRDELAKVSFNQVFCSNLIRSVSTARIICERQSLAPVVIRELQEINMGLWDGVTFEEIRYTYPGEFEKRGADIIKFRPPGGESFAECSSRVLSALDEIVRTARGKILIIGHAGVNRIILSRALGMPLENMLKIKQDYGCLNILKTNNLVQQVEEMNLTF